MRAAFLLSPLRYACRRPPGFSAHIPGLKRGKGGRDFARWDRRRLENVGQNAHAARDCNITGKIKGLSSSGSAIFMH